MTDEALDDLLSQPLADVADDGFSSRILAAVTAAEARRSRITIWATALGALCIAPFLPLREIGAIMTRTGPVLANSLAMSIAAAALILTFSLAQRLRE